jgi:hypothetical protein
MRKNIIIIIILLFASCGKDESPKLINSARTIIVRVAADSDL